jgi:hypothetical protein
MDDFPLMRGKIRSLCKSLTGFMLTSVQQGLQIMNYPTPLVAVLNISSSETLFFRFALYFCLEKLQMSQVAC